TGRILDAPHDEQAIRVVGQDTRAALIGEGVHALGGGRTDLNRPEALRILSVLLHHAAGRRDEEGEARVGRRLREGRAAAHAFEERQRHASGPSCIEERATVQRRSGEIGGTTKGEALGVDHGAALALVNSGLWSMVKSMFLTEASLSLLCAWRLVRSATSPVPRSRARANSVRLAT